VKPGLYDEVLSFEDGEIIAREGDETRDMYVVQSGAVEVFKAIGGQQVLLAVLGRGSFFGEMSLLESLPRSATVRAKGRAKLLAIRAGSLLLKIRRDPTFAFEMLQQMSGRIRRLNEQLAKQRELLEAVQQKQVTRGGFASARARLASTSSGASTSSAR
jgi:CRP/FNR family transcriptional regulator, cyclic AMP receptor protein